MAASRSVALVLIVVAAVLLQVSLLEKVTIDNDEIAFAYDGYLLTQHKNPLSFGAAKGFGLWVLLAGWISFVGLESFVSLKAFSIVGYLFSVLALSLIFFREWRRPLAGLVAVTLYSVSPYLLTSHVYIHSQNLQIPLMLFGLLFYLRARRAPPARMAYLALSGIFFGFAFVTRENTVFHIAALVFVMLFLDAASLRDGLRRVLAFSGGAGVSVITALLVATRGVDIQKIFMIVRWFVNPATGATTGSVVKNVTDMIAFAHFPYSMDLVFLLVFGLGVCMLFLYLQETPARSEEGMTRRMSGVRYFLMILLPVCLFVVLATSFRLYSEYQGSDCALRENPDIYCLRDRAQGRISPGVVGVAVFILASLFWRPGKISGSKFFTGEQWLVAALLLVPITVGFLKHIRFTTQYLFEFYPGVVILSALGVEYLFRARKFVVIAVLAFTLLVSYTQARYFIGGIPMSGSYTYRQIDELKRVVDTLPQGKPLYVFTASTTIAKLIGGEPLVHISHPISYGLPVSEEIKYALYPLPEEIVETMRSECNSIVLEDLLTQKSYFEEEGPIQQYVSENFKEFYHLEDEERTKILVRKEPCSS